MSNEKNLKIVLSPDRVIHFNKERYSLSEGESDDLEKINGIKNEKKAICGYTPLGDKNSLPLESLVDLENRITQKDEFTYENDFSFCDDCIKEIKLEKLPIEVSKE